VVAEGIAGGPVGDIFRDPAFECPEIIRFIFVIESIGPCAGDKRLLDVTGLPELFAELKDGLFAEGFYSREIQAGEFFHSGVFNAVGGDGFFEEPAAGGSESGVSLLLEPGADERENIFRHGYIVEDSVVSGKGKRICDLTRCKLHSRNYFAPAARREYNQ